MERTAKTPSALLTADHKAVKALFKQFVALEESDDTDQKAALVEKICTETRPTSSTLAPRS